MNRIPLLFILLAVFSGGPAIGQGFTTPPLPATSSPNVIVIPVSGTIDAANAAFVGRSIREREKHKDKIILLELDTYGGEVDAAFRIVDTMLSITDCPTIAYVKTKAISAGALIALSCNRIVMQHNTTIGDVAPLMMSQEGPKMLGEKFQSPIRAKFRTLAKRNGYPERLTEAMVTTGMVVYKVVFKDTTAYLDSTELADLPPEKKRTIVSQTTVVKRGELLTLNDVEAKALSFSRMSVSGLDEALKILGFPSPNVIRIERNWSEEFVKFIGTIAPILMTIGIALLYIEFKTPGFGVPGIIGAFLIGLVFFSQYMVGLANYTEMLLALAGIVLIAVEIFLFPTMGLLLMAGAALVVISLVLSMQGFVLPKPEFPWQRTTLVINLAKVLGSFITAGVLSLLFVRYGLPKIAGVVKGPFLTDTLVDAHAASGADLPLASGDSGVVVTALRPAGRAKINNEEYDVVADGEFVEKGAAITISMIDGGRIVVIREKKNT
ncbi:MAG: ATP-dependent Clp protease proteolytic subunit [Chitinispirillaceae bacterium]|nr:ATP-dependent Clp protease proteolytic subunit [Chitinispirillaceae bacterium]